MRKFLPVDQLARDERFAPVSMKERMTDPRSALDVSESSSSGGANRKFRLTPERRDASDGARGLMHGVFVGEVQALEGAGHTCFDFDTTGVDATDAELSLIHI